MRDLTPDQRRRRSAGLMAAQYDRATPEEGSVVQRHGLLPLATYDNGRTGLAFPGLLAEPVESFNRLMQNGYQGGTGDTRGVEDAFNVAGAAMMGGFAAPKPNNTVGMFGGRLAKTADHAKLAQAEEMTARGVPGEQIWKETGWFPGIDGKWRFEIDDSASTFNRAPPSSVGSYLSRRGGQATNANRQDASTLSGALNHDNLYAAYPDMASMEFSRSGYGGVGYYAPPQWNKFEGRTIPEAIGVKNEAEFPRAVTLHEAQHAIQNREGFATGGSRGDFTPDQIAAERERLGNSTGSDVQAGLNLYNRLAGEVEARAVEARRNLTPQQRAERPPWLDYGVNSDDQIVRFGNDGPQLSAESRPGAALGAAVSSLDNNVPGIRATHVSPHNFERFDIGKVVFDDGLIEILRKYGLLGMAGGAAVNEMLSGAQEQRKAPWSNAMLPGDA